MQILNDSDREFVRNRFENELVNEVNLILFTQSDLGGLVLPGRECETCAPTEQLLKEVSETSDLINFKKLDIQKDAEEAARCGISRIPSFLVSREDETNIRYLGIPAGTEFPVLMEALVNVSSGEPKLAEETKAFLQTLTDELLIKTFVTPN
jgi:alkyl hydroperoxide reductase subunit AhpF